jgi:hypothetical protein
MTDDDELKKLFERTKKEPSAFELTRMAARARELPARFERVPRRLPRWTWAPAFAAVAALGALGVTLTQTPAPNAERSSPDRPEPPPGAPAPRISSDPSARAALAPLAQARETKPEDEAELDSLSLGADLDDDPFDLSSVEEMEISK